MISSAMDTISHVYPFWGVCHVKLIQISSSGARDTTSMSLNLNQAGPSGHSLRLTNAAFSYYISNAFSVTFTNTSANASSYLWELGDSTTSISGTTIQKNYPAPASFYIKLTASNPAGVDSCSYVKF